MLGFGASNVNMMYGAVPSRDRASALFAAAHGLQEEMYAVGGAPLSTAGYVQGGMATHFNVPTERPLSSRDFMLLQTGADLIRFNTWTSVEQAIYGYALVGAISWAQAQQVFDASDTTYLTPGAGAGGWTPYDTGNSDTGYRSKLLFNTTSGLGGQTLTFNIPASHNGAFTTYWAAPSAEGAIIDVTIDGVPATSLENPLGNPSVSAVTAYGWGVNVDGAPSTFIHGWRLQNLSAGTHTIVYTTRVGTMAGRVYLAGWSIEKAEAAMPTVFILGQNELDATGYTNATITRTMSDSEVQGVNQLSKDILTYMAWPSAKVKFLDVAANGFNENFALMDADHVHYNPTGQAAIYAMMEAAIAPSAPINLVLGASGAQAAALLGLTAPTQVPLAASVAQAAAAMALKAATQVPLASSAAQAAATLALRAPTLVPLAPSAAVASDSLALTAPMPVVLGASVAVAAASLGLSAPALLSLLAAGQVGTSLELTGPKQVDLNPSAAIAAGTLALRAPTQIPLAASIAVAAATLAVRIPEGLPLDAAAAIAGGSLALTAPTRIPLDPSAAAAAAALALTGQPKLSLSAAALSDASLIVRTSANLPLGVSAAHAAATLLVSRPFRVPLAASEATSGGSMKVKAATRIGLGPSAARAAATMKLRAKPTLALGASAAHSGASLGLQIPILAGAEANGIYVMTTVGDGSHQWVLTRATDADSAEEIRGIVVYALAGDDNEFSLWACKVGRELVVGETALPFAKGPTF